MDSPYACPVSRLSDSSCACSQRTSASSRAEKFASYVDMAKWLTSWRNAPETAWLSEGPVHPQQQVLRRLEEAYKRFFAKTGGFPKFKPYGLDPGIRFPDPKQFSIDAANGRIKLPKLGWIRMRQSKEVTGALRNLTLTREGDKWFVSIQTRGAEVAPALDLQPTLDRPRRGRFCGHFGRNSHRAPWCSQGPAGAPAALPAGCEQESQGLVQSQEGDQEAGQLAPAHCAPAQWLAAQVEH